MSTQIGSIDGSVTLDVKPLERAAKRVKTETDKVTASLFNAQKTASGLTGQLGKAASGLSGLNSAMGGALGSTNSLFGGVARLGGALAGGGILGIGLLAATSAIAWYNSGLEEAEKASEKAKEAAEKYGLEIEALQVKLKHFYSSVTDQKMALLDVDFASDSAKLLKENEKFTKAQDKLNKLYKENQEDRKKRWDTEIDFLNRIKARNKEIESAEEELAKVRGEALAPLQTQLGLQKALVLEAQKKLDKETEIKNAAKATELANIRAKEAATQYKTAIEMAAAATKALHQTGMSQLEKDLDNIAEQAKKYAAALKASGKLQDEINDAVAEYVALLEEAAFQQQAIRDAAEVAAGFEASKADSAAKAAKALKEQAKASENLNNQMENYALAATTGIISSAGSGNISGMMGAGLSAGTGAIGAGIGSAIPVIGTAAGGAIGSAIGGAVTSVLGPIFENLIGAFNHIADSIGSSLHSDTIMSAFKLDEAGKAVGSLVAIMTAAFTAVALFVALLPLTATAGIALASAFTLLTVVIHLLLLPIAPLIIGLKVLGAVLIAATAGAAGIAALVKESENFKNQQAAITQIGRELADSLGYLAQPLWSLIAIIQILSSTFSALIQSTLNFDQLGEVMFNVVRRLLIWLGNVGIGLGHLDVALSSLIVGIYKWANSFINDPVTAALLKNARARLKSAEQRRDSLIDSTQEITDLNYQSAIAMGENIAMINKEREARNELILGFGGNRVRGSTWRTQNGLSG